MAPKNPLRQDEMTPEQEQEAARRLAALLRQRQTRADAQERQAQRDIAEMQERTRLVRILVQTVEDLPTGEQGHIRAMCNFVFGQMASLPISEHIPLITQMFTLIRSGDTALARENAMRQFCARFEGANHRKPSAEGMPSEFLHYNSRTGQTSQPSAQTDRQRLQERYEREIERIRQVEMDRLLTEPVPPIVVNPRSNMTVTGLQVPESHTAAYEEITRVTQNYLDRMMAPSPLFNAITGRGNKQPEPPKPTGHKFSGKRRFKLEE